MSKIRKVSFLFVGFYYIIKHYINRINITAIGLFVHIQILPVPLNVLLCKDFFKPF